MTPANRHDELQDALREIARICQEKIADMLVKKDMEIIMNLAYVDSELSKVKATVTEENAQQWYSGYLASESNHIDFSWEESYVILLEDYTSSLDPACERSCLAIERKQGILRWNTTSIQYKQHYNAALYKQLEQARRDMIVADMDYQCYIAIIRSHEHHNYSQRAHMSSSIQKAFGKLHQCAEAWNALRTKLNISRMTIKEIRDQNILSWSYEISGNYQNKQNSYYYEMISLRTRSMEERIFVNAEIKALLEHGVAEVRRFHSRLMGGEIAAASKLHTARRNLYDCHSKLSSIIVRERISTPSHMEAFEAQ